MTDCVSKMLTGHININGNDAVTSTHNRIRIVVVAATVGTAAHRYDPFWRRHLVVDFAQSRRHLVCDCAGNNDCVWLTRTGAKHNTVSVHVVARRCDVHHFDGTTRQAECHRPQRTLSNNFQIIGQVCFSFWIALLGGQSWASRRDEPMQSRSCSTGTPETVRTWTAYRLLHRQHS